jgi:hypothetical protein
MRQPRVPSFSGELSYTDQPFRKLVEFPLLQWLRVGVISMETLRNLKLPALHSMVIHTVQGSYPISAPDPHTLVLKELRILPVTTVNPSVSCIVVPKLETLCLGITDPQKCRRRQRTQRNIRWLGLHDQAPTSYPYHTGTRHAPDQRVETPS